MPQLSAMAPGLVLAGVRCAPIPHMPPHYLPGNLRSPRDCWYNRRMFDQQPPLPSCCCCFNWNVQRYFDKRCAPRDAPQLGWWHWCPDWWEQFTPDQPRADLAVVAAESDGNIPILLPFLAIPAHTTPSTCLLNTATTRKCRREEARSGHSTAFIWDFKFEPTEFWNRMH